MQVTEQSENITHAIIGGEESINFGISSDPAFFHILSSTLYSDQKLAVVRETICNAWDSHIESGITEPIAIELTNTELVIRDFGKGIPKDMIGPIYGIYGGSTKKNDGSQTGGFGLGCKAPFSYTDTFTVTSWNQGTKTVYVMSKSSSEVMGKPSITPIVSVPTDQSGIEVRIPIKANDKARLLEDISDVLFFGGITATVNNCIFHTLTYPTEHGFTVFSDNKSSARGLINIKYGNVIYPVPKHIDYASEYLSIVDILYKSHYSPKEYTLILEANSDTISITPSRETLSMQGNTITTIKELLLKFINLCAVAKQLLTNEIVKTITDTVNDKQFKFIFKTLDQKFNYIQELYSNTTATTLNDLAKVSLTNRNNYYKTKINVCKLYIDLLVNNKIITTALARKYKKYDYIKQNKLSWLLKHIIQPLVNRMPDGMMKSRLFRMDSKFTLRKYAERNTMSSETIYGYLTKTVVISYAQRGNEDRLLKQELFKSYGDFAYLLYHAPRSANKVKQAIDHFTKFGFTVINLTIANEGEDASIIEPEKKVQALTKRLVGIPIASAELYFDKDVARIEKPEWVTVFNNNYDDRCHYSVTDDYKFTFPTIKDAKATALIIKFFGSIGGIAKTKPQRDAYISKGALTLTDYLIKTLAVLIKTNAELISYYSSEMFNSNCDNLQLLCCIQKDAELCKELDLDYTSISDTTKEYVYLIDKFSISLNYYSPNKTLLSNLIDDIKPNDKLITIKDRINTAYKKPDMLFANVDALCTAINYSSPNAPLARSIILNLLK